MIKTWQERIVTANPPYIDPEEINKAMLEEIDELRADAARYRDALKSRIEVDMKSWYKLHYLMKKHGWHPGRTDDDLIEVLDEKLDALAADAARYQWITKQITADTFDNLEKAFGVFGDAESCTQAEFDACIDAAMKEDSNA